MSNTTVTPELLWAQRSSKTDASKNYIYLTINAPDVTKEKLQLDIAATNLTFTGYSETQKKNYHVELEFYAEIDPANSKTSHTSRFIELVLRKKELKEEYWPRLLKETRKLHFLKTDFDKWLDEDEQNDAPEDDYMNNFAGGADVPFGAGDNGLGGIDFSKLGGAGTGAGMPAESDSSDDDMPDLEDDAKADKSEEAEQKDKPKIEEIA